MAGTISAFFSSLLPSYKGPTTNSGRFDTESGTTGSARSAASYATSSSSSGPVRDEQHAAEWAAAAASQEDDNAVARGAEPDAAADPDELRKLRAQFLDQKFGPQGKKRRAGRTFASPKGEGSQP